MALIRPKWGRLQNQVLILDLNECWVVAVLAFADGIFTVSLLQQGMETNIQQSMQIKKINS